MKQDNAVEISAAFQAMADSSPVLLWMSRKDSQCVFFNKTWLEFTGKSLEQEWGIGWAEGIHPADFQPCVDTYQENFRARKPFEMEYRLRRHDGAYRWILDRGVPRYNEIGEFEGFIGSCIDITERKEYEDKLKATAAELLRSNIELEQFAFVASHDLQTPLRQIGIYAQLLGKKYAEQNSSEMQRWNTYLQRGVERMHKLISKLLVLSRAGKATNTFAPHSMSEILSRVMLDLESEINTRRAAVISNDLPTLVCNATLMHQVFQNLIENSLKFVPFGTEPVIRVSFEDQESQWLFSIEDNGIGVPVKFQDKIFETFFRLPGEIGSQGHGIGLSLVRKIITLHHGEIWLDAEKKGGARFCFTISKELQHHE